MGHDTLVRATLAVVSVFAAAAIVFAIRGTTPPSPADVAHTADPAAAAGAPGTTTAGVDGAAHFEDRCGRCHDGGDFTGWAARHPDTSGRGQWLEHVLASHHAPPAEERGPILAYIQQAIAAGER